MKLNSELIAAAETTVHHQLHKAPPDGSRVESLDALRGLAALAVCWFHVSHSGKLLPAGWLADWSAHGDLGVAVFFVISGFVIPWALRRESPSLSNYPKFLAKRLIRLHPPYIAAVLGAIFLNWISIQVPGYRGPWGEEYLPNAMRSSGLDLLYLNAFFGQNWVLLVAWTLAIEVQFYLLAGLAAPGFAARSHWKIIGGFATALASAWVFPSHDLIFHYLPIFALGWAAAWLGINPNSRMPWLAAAMALTSITYHYEWMTAATAAGTFLTIIFWSTRPHSALLWLGTISYSLYLVHVPVGSRITNLAIRWVPEGPGRILLVAVAVGGSILAAWIFWRIIEMPFQTLSRNCFKKILSSAQAEP